MSVCVRERTVLRPQLACARLEGGVYFWGRDEQGGACVSVPGGAQHTCYGLRVCRGAAGVRGASGEEGAAWERP